MKLSARRGAALVAASMLVPLAACSQATSSSSSSGSSSGKATTSVGVGVTGGFGEKPTLTVPSTSAPARLTTDVLTSGTGTPVTNGQSIVVNYLGQTWDAKDGKPNVFDNSYDRKTALAIQLAQGGIIDGWRYGLVGRKAGSRVEMAVPPTWGYGTQGNPQAGIKGTDTLVFVVDVKGTYPVTSSAKGKEVAQGDADLPKVGTNTDGKAPSVEVPKKDAPTALIANYIIEGDGEALAATDSVLVQYKGLQWDTGKEFNSTYESRTLAPFALSQLVKGWSQGLVGKKVGSRVLIVIPPKLGYGDSPPSGSGIKKNATLVFTVDILAKL